MSASNLPVSDGIDPLTAGLNGLERLVDEGKRLKYADIGINLSDPVFRGIYHDKEVHKDDLDAIIQRALEAGCRKLMVTGSDLEESRKAIQLAKDYPKLCYATVGIHPCSAHRFESYPGGPSAKLKALKKLATEASIAGHAVAFGEIGLDYDRLYLCPKDVQLKYFAAQLDLAVELQLPLFLHSRAAAEDFEMLLGERLQRLPKVGVVHSFTGTRDEADRLLKMGLYIGINGCSLKTEENIDVVKDIPLNRLMIETDGPWCEMRPSHASAAFLKDAPPLPKAVKKEKWAPGLMVKGRNEPATIPRVAFAVARIKDISLEALCEATWENTIRVFGMNETI